MNTEKLLAAKQKQPTIVRGATPHMHYPHLTRRRLLEARHQEMAAAIVWFSKAKRRKPEFDSRIGHQCWLYSTTHWPT